MHTHVGTLNVFCFALACLCKIPIKIQSTVDDRYLDLSGEFVKKENQRTRFYAEIVNEDPEDFRFRIVDGRGRALNVRQKDQRLVWTRPKDDGTVWSVRKLPDRETGYVMTDTCLCLKHSPDKVYLEMCPKSKSTAACPDYIFKVSFKFNKRKLGECRMVLAAERNCKAAENAKAIADCARTFCSGRRSSVRAECSTCKKIGCCKPGPDAVRVIDARKALSNSPCECNDSSNRHTNPLAISNVPTSARSPRGMCSKSGASTNPKLNMVLQEYGDAYELSELGGDSKVEESKRKNDILSSIAGGQKQRENIVHSDEEIPSRRQYLVLNSQENSNVSGNSLDSAAVKEIINAITVLNGDGEKNAQNSLESVKNALIKNLSSETLEAMAKEKRKLEDDAALKIGILSKQLAESKDRDGLSRTSSQNKRSSAENMLERITMAAADTRYSSDKTTRRINNVAGEPDNISKVFGDRETKKKEESVTNSMGEIASLAKSLAPPQVSLATSILSKLGI